MSAPADAALSPPVSAGLPRPPLTWLASLNLLLLAAAAAALSLLLWPHWSENPDLSHGWFMPVVFVLLLLEARSGPPRYLESSAVTRTALALLILLGLLALTAAGAYAAAVDWSHALVACVLTIAFVCLLGAGLLTFSSTTTRVIPLNWSACVAIGLWLLSAPIPPGTYTRLTIGLQLMVTSNVLDALHLLGIAATRQGNIIQLATTTVGVEDACSGVRSLVSCIFAGFFFSATLVRRTWARLLIVGLAGPLALTMNFIRSLVLTLLANRGVDISGAWHDYTGFAVLGVTAALLGALALLLERKPLTRPANPAAPTTQNPKPKTQNPTTRSPFRPHLPLTLTLTAAAALALFFFLNTRPSIRQHLPPPDLAGVLPAQSAGWYVETPKNLYQFSSVLRTEHLAQRTYLRRTPAGVEQITIYLAYWPAGQAAVSLVASHTPDACWPGSGWTTAPIPRASEQLSLPDRPLPPAEARFFKNGDIPQNVWFWHLYDGRAIPYRDPYSAGKLLAIALRYGFTRDGDQLFVRISSNRPWSTFANEPLLAEIFDRLQPLGL